MQVWFNRGALSRILDFSRGYPPQPSEARPHPRLSPPYQPHPGPILCGPLQLLPQICARFCKDCHPLDASDSSQL